MFKGGRDLECGVWKFAVGVRVSRFFTKDPKNINLIFPFFFKKICEQQEKTEVCRNCTKLEL